ncbi:hypothetical protein ACVIHI_001493 [Bradyrhizobium sp. USDA 4524]|uniref:hypothetical protein n=1 Tax=unclassified Bradyrhizobium TaxID=2631580 RepID=UPI00209E7DA0|nr:MULTISPECIES: hypothetical protein [unclassified Bradyrhizobium]MCP1837132.1 hypothetical protein [Bradyrhizobium sp. USDA 4538]MCP1906151.1 hypothetical protein [Bradyrhizobium sp. USDA 4537]MCP1988195.1 hypothetical protein [Bradyrhizobium sp. USDA 4539]
MDAEWIEPAITACLKNVHAKLKEAEQIARAAAVCAEAGSVSEGVRVSMDIEQLSMTPGGCRTRRLCCGHCCEPETT